MITYENKSKLNLISNWKKLNEVCKSHKIKLNKIINKYKTTNKIAAYGASARSSTLINYLNLNNKIIKKIFDLNSLKSELYTPGTHIKIQKPIPQSVKNFDVIILLAWNFKDEILQFLKKIKFKGDVIIPLPKIELVKLKK